jgi:RNA polymerase sigma-70 factor (sigma-E family)
MDDFEDYVRARGNALLRFAYVLCGDAHRAEDLVQEALIRCHRRWNTITRRGEPEAYVRKAILREYLSWRRRKSAGDLVTDRLVGRSRVASPAGAIEERDALRRLLEALPRKQRAVLVLRYYEDLPDARIADLLACSQATVRVHARRGLGRLRRQVEAMGLTLALEEKV